MNGKVFAIALAGFVTLISFFLLLGIVTKSATITRKGDPPNIDAVLARQAQAWEQHDFSVAAQDWDESGTLTSPGGQFPVTEMQSVITDYAKHFKELHVKVTNVFQSPDGKQAAVEWDWEVTRVRDGKHGVTHDAILITFEHGKIKSWREYFDLGDSVDAAP